jgi:hypothetical protein
MMAAVVTAPGRSMSSPCGRHGRVVKRDVAAGRWQRDAVCQDADEAN